MTNTESFIFCLIINIVFFVIGAVINLVWGGINFNNSRKYKSSVNIKNPNKSPTAVTSEGNAVVHQNFGVANYHYGLSNEEITRSNKEGLPYIPISGSTTADELYPANLDIDFTDQNRYPFRYRGATGDEDE